MKQQIPPIAIILVIVILLGLVGYGVYYFSKPQMPPGAHYIQLSPEQAKKTKHYNM